MYFWQLGESHYWGHNAIIRMAPFIWHCGLPALPGSGALSGEVLSHDFVEAALMRRAGWKVWVVHDLAGSYEQVPPNLLAELQRDRRWCHGNLQNSRLMFEPSLHTVHRSVFVTGVLAYASAPLWLAFLLLSSVLFARHAGDIPVYFIEPYQLFPLWPTANLKLILTLFGLTGVLLLAPKALSLLVTIIRSRAHCFGGFGRLIASAFLEFLHSLLLAPVRMLFHTQFLVAALTGLKLDWKSPPRDDTSTSWAEGWRRHGVHSILAVVWMLAIHASGAPFPWWLSPIILGMLLATPLSVWGSRASVGRRFREHRLLLIPEELEPPAVLLEARRHAARISEQPVTFIDAITNARMQQRVSAANPPRAPFTALKLRARAERIARVLHGGPEGLGVEERLRLIGDSAALDAIREQLESRRSAAGWWNGLPVSLSPGAAEQETAVAVDPAQPRYAP
jgi:membrane glycosyltransferase